VEIEWSNDSGIILRRGEVLVNTNLPITITTGDCKVNIDGGVIALLSNVDGILTVRGLGERSLSPITVASGSKFIKLHMGQELVVGANEKATLVSAKSDGIARRRLETVSLADNQTAVYGEFSILSVLENHSLLRRLSHSKQRTDRSVVDSIVKSGASLMVVTASRGAYQ
ncbi:MAG: hypothetical protein K2X29_09455, partial [Candidatus Obscuribacterales bacterium]|nr:hypothetical protein [Candidatus Obscuribacterales bacterium]